MPPLRGWPNLMELYITEHALRRVKERVPDISDEKVEGFIRSAWRSKNMSQRLDYIERHNRRKYERKLSTKNLIYKDYGGYIFCFRTYRHSATKAMAAKLLTMYRK